MSTEPEPQSNSMTENSGGTRIHWSSRTGFLLAAVGSAIGLGNIWKFPYITGKYGGGAFVLVYLGCVILVGLPLMIAEFMVGRRAQTNPVNAFQKLHVKGSPWQAVGWLGVASAVIILSFYSVIGGWVLAYLFKSISGFQGGSAAIADQFGALVGSSGTSIFWHTIFMTMTIGIILGGVQQGIERWAKILMPALFALLFGFMIYGLFFTGGGSQAVSFLFNPDFSKLSGEGVLSALGHAFFTLSLGMGTMITYGSYMGRNTRIVGDAIAISFLDTLIALMAGLAIFSIVFANGIEPGGGPGLIFQTLPVLFAQTGIWLSIPFFVLLTFAALTSSISMLEVAVAYFVDGRGWSRKKATLSMGGFIYLIGLLSAASSLTIPFMGEDKGFLDVFDFISTNYMLPIGGFLTCLFVGWVVSDKIRSEEFGSSGMLYKGLVFVLKFVTPVAVLIVILHGLKLLPFMDY